MVLFVLFGVAALMPLATAFATPVDDTDYTDGGFRGPTTGSGLTNYTDYWNNLYGDATGGNFSFSEDNIYELGEATPNSDGSVTITDPAGEVTTVPPNPTGVGGADTGSAVTYSSQVQLEKSHGLLVTVGGWVAGVGGNMFELAYTNFALKMGCYFVAGGEDCTGGGVLVSNGQVGGVVNVLWGVIRDLINILIIFSLIYIGFMLIVSGDDSGTKKALGGIIMAALLVNFSLYIAKVVVDLSNFTTTAIYSAMDAAGDRGFSVDGGDGDIAIASEANGNTLASHFMTVLRITTMYQTRVGEDNSLGFAILAMFFLIFLGAIFLYGAIMMLARFLAIIVLLIFSPVMFLGLVLPNFKSISSSWRQKFVGYCLFAPAFTFMIYISLYTLIQMAPATGSSGYGAAFAGDGAAAASSMPIFLFFFVGAGLLFMSTKVAGTIASGSGSFLTKTADGFAKKISYGAAGAITTAVPGLAGKGMTTWSDNIEKKTGRSTTLSRSLNYSGTKLKEQKIGGVSTASAIASTKKFIEGKDRVTAADKRAQGLHNEAEKGKKISAALATLNDTTASSTDKERTLIGLKGDVIALMKEKGGVEALKNHAKYLRPDQIKALEDDKDLNKAEVKSVLESRSNSLKTTYGSKLDTAQTSDLTVYSPNELATENMAIQLSEDQIRKLPEPKFIDADKDRILEKRKEAIITAARGGTITLPDGTTVVDKTKLLGARTADIAKYPAEALKAMAAELPIPSLTKIVQDGVVSQADQNAIRTTIQTFINASPTTPKSQDYDDWLKGPIGKQLGK
jgi:hypothetical protein